MSGRRLAVVGEAWELPFAALTLDALRRGPVRFDEVIVPPELAGLADPAPASAGPAVRVAGGRPGRFRPYPEILADLTHRVPETRLVPAGSDSAGGEQLPPHRPPSPRRHRRTRIGQLDVWTLDTGEHYFAALLASNGPAPTRPVWPAYGAGQPVFTRNTNDFDEAPVGPCDDYVILGSGLLGWRMVLDSDPRPGSRVLVYDINPDQLAWSRHVLAGAGTVPTLAELEGAFRAAHPDAAIRATLPHERANAEAQARWYAARRAALGELAGRVRVDHVLVDLLRTPSVLLDRLTPDRTVFFMYLDLFTVWQVADEPPWIVQLPGLARSLERAVRTRTAAAAFLPGPRSSTLQLAGSLLAQRENGHLTCM